MPHARPFLHFLELTSRAGIFFEAHESIRKHVAISTLLINAFAASEEEEVLSLSLDESSLLDSLHVLDVRLARAFRFAIGHAEELESRGYESAGWQPHFYFWDALRILTARP